MRRLLLGLAGASALWIGPAVAEEEGTKVDGFAVAGVDPKAADADAPLAEGWPRATAPGTIEVKSFPAYRSAVARVAGKGDAQAGQGGESRLFFRLFAHIQRSNVAMTAPVVSTRDPGADADDAKDGGPREMEFVYRRPTQGEAGPGVGAVRVEDHPAATYLCLGVQGTMSEARYRRGVEALRAWLGDHKDRWIEAGPPREIGYHAPMTARNRRLFEVQIPLKPAPATRPGP